MKKALLTIFIFFAVITTGWLFATSQSSASGSVTITIGGYNNYAPFGYMDENDKWKTVFQKVFENMAAEIDANIVYKFYDIKDTDIIARDIREAKVDLFVGAYNQTEEFENLYLIFPAMVSNPVALFVLPSQISEIKSLEDMKKLRGARYSGEVFNDFVENKLQTYNLERIDSAYDMFEKLFTKKIDYILSGYYFGMIEAVKIGINHQIAASKQTLLNIPVFVGITQMSPYRDLIARHVNRYFQDEKVVADIKDNFRAILEDFENKYAGVVPPTFGLEKEVAADKNKVEEVSALKE